MNNIIKRRRKGFAISNSFANTYSMSLDGTNDSFNTGSDFQAFFRGSWTVGFWLNMDNFNTGSSEYLWGSSKSPSASVYMDMGTNGQLRLTFRGSQPVASGFWLSSSAVFTTLGGSAGTGGNWKHIAVSMSRPDGSGNVTVKMYVDGSAISVTESTALDKDVQAAFAPGGTNIAFGGLNYQTSYNVLYHTECLMDEIAMWDVALSDDSMAVVGGSVFNLKAANGNYTNQSDLVSHWRFTEGENTSVEDATGNSDGTLVNGPTWSTNTPS